MNDFDPDRYRQDSVEQWDAAAPGWDRRQQEMREFAGPVANWLVDALELAPGQRVLDLGAGLGDVGLLASDRVGPGGSVVIADQSEAMLRLAEQRAKELGAANVQTKRIDAEWLDFELGSLDAIASRWALMLVADPDAALRECRRVLRSGGRLAFSVWDTPARNPWAAAPAMVLAERGLMQLSPPTPGSFRPGMFALADSDALAERVAEAGFAEVTVESLALTRSHADFRDFWETSLDMSPGFHDAVMSCPPTEIEQIEAAVSQALSPFTLPDGSLEIPASTLVAKAEA